MIMGDTVLQQLFPHEGLPYHVWIDAGGRFRYATEGYNATVENIRKFAAGQPLRLAGYQGRPTYITSLFNSAWQNKLEYYSYLSKTVWGYAIGANLDTSFAHISCNAYSVVDLYLAAYSEEGNFLRPGRLELHFKDSLPYMLPRDPNLIDSWRQQYCYNYDLQLPRHQKNRLLPIMKQDLQRYFNLGASVEKRRKPGLALVRTGTGDKLATKTDIPRQNLVVDNIRTPERAPVRYFYHQPYKDLSGRLGAFVEYYLQLPFMDNTGIDPGKLIDFKMDGDLLDHLTLENFKKALKPYGLDLVPREQEVEVLVLTEKEPGR